MFDQPIHIGVEVRIVPYARAVAISEIFQAFGETLVRRQLRILDEERDYRDVSLESGLDLDSNVVARIIEATRARGSNPSVANNNESDAAFAYNRVYVPSEISAERKGVDILENRVFPESLDKTVIDAPNNSRRVLSAITDEYLVRAFHLS